MNIEVIKGFLDIESGTIIEKYSKVEVEEKRGQELIALGLAKKLPAKSQRKKK